MMIPLEVQGRRGVKCENMYVEPHVNFTRTTGLLGLSAVFAKKGVAASQVVNYSESSITLVQGFPFGLVQEAELKVKREVSGKGTNVVGENTSKTETKDSISLEERQEFVRKNLNLEDSGLSEKKRQDLRDLMHEFADIVSTCDKDIGRTNLVSHVIDTGDERPIFQRPYRAEFKRRAVIEEEVNKYLAAEWIEPSNSAWSSPIVLVTKKDGAVRFCINYIKLNDVTKRDCYALPLIPDILGSLSRSKYFTGLDMASGYHQIPMSDYLDSKDKTTFSCFLGTFRFKYMPFGLKNAPMTFQRLMERVLSGILYEKCFVFIDDILVTGKTWSEHLDNLRQVLLRLRAAGLKLRLKKCSFGKKETLYLGHIIDEDGIRVDPAKVEAIRNLPPPTTVKALKSFLGLCGYYSKFIWHYSDLTSCFNFLTRKNVPYVWTEECQKNFEALKDALTNAPCLAYPNFELPFTLYCDASEMALGSVLCQKEEGQEERPIGYYSRSFLSAERRYSNTEREMLAMYEGLRNFRPYVYGGACDVYTDHKAIEALRNTENPTQRLAKWQYYLMGQVDWKVKYVPGKKNQVADFLSRAPLFTDVGKQNIIQTAERVLEQEKNEVEPVEIVEENTEVKEIVSQDSIPRVAVMTRTQKRNRKKKRQQAREKVEEEKCEVEEVEEEEEIEDIEEEIGKIAKQNERCF